MKIIAIDTSGQQAGAAIVACDAATPNDMISYHSARCGITLGEITVNAHSGVKSWHHSEALLPAIQQMLALSGLTLGDMDAVAYTCGPGSFTGVRIGAATALGLARGAGLPVVAVPTLDALAYNSMGMMDDGYVVPMLDARREQVYGAVYHAGKEAALTRTSDYMAISIHDLLQTVSHQFPREEHNTDILLIGDGADANAGVIRAHFPHARFAPANNNRVRPASVGLWALQHIGQAQPAAGEPQLIYVRPPQAVREAGNRTTAT